MSQSSHIKTPWSSWHNRLHKSLLSKKDLLPYGSCLLLSISGGQDSIVLLKLISDLQRLYKWEINIWHGNHGWHKESQKIASELKVWCLKQGFNFSSQTACRTQVQTEDSARNWRYENLCAKAKSISQKNNNLDCKHVLTGHTASDQTETLIMNLARGTYLSGLSSLRDSRTLEDKIKLVRPLLIFTREETSQICKEFNLPIWLDPTNSDLHFNRNRIRHQIIPILEEIHPRSTCRIASLSERLANIKNNQDVLIDIVIETIRNSKGICREKLSELPQETRIIILAKWLKNHGVPTVSASQLEQISNYIGKSLPPGKQNLKQGWKIRWNKQDIEILHYSEN